MSAKKLLSDIIELDSKIADLRDAFDECEASDQKRALAEMFDVELKTIGGEDPVSIALVRAADMAIPLREDGAELLARGLAHGNPDVRSVAGESLLGIAEDGFAAIRPAVDFALGAGCPAAEEMPFVLAMTDDADTAKTIAEFLKCKDPDAVAAAIEALADFGDPSSIPALRALLEDKRVVTVEGEDEGEGEGKGEGLQTWTIGDLAAEAIEMIEEEEE
jgi:HEAT repeat protein